MPKKQNEESPEKQFERFRQKVEDMERDGELNPTEAEERFEEFVRKSLRTENR